MAKIGDKIVWKTLNGYGTGIVTAESDYGYLVELENGRNTIVHPHFIVNNVTENTNSKR